MARVRIKNSKKFQDDAYSKFADVTFQNAFKNAADRFVHLGAVARASGDVDLEHAVVGLAGLCMGMWLELHRIADALEMQNGFAEALHEDHASR